MGDKYDAKAREIHKELTYAPFGITGDDDRRKAIVDIIASALRSAAAEEREECAKEASLNWHSMKMLGSSYVDGALDAGQRIARAIRSRGIPND